jgi:hypothetical protein
MGILGEDFRFQIFDRRLVGHECWGAFGNDFLALRFVNLKS